MFQCLSKKYNINTVVLGHSKHIEGSVAVCVCVYASTVSVRLYCVMFLHKDLNVFLAIGGYSFSAIRGYSCLATNCEVLILVNGKFKKHFLKTSQFGNLPSTS